MDEWPAIRVRQMRVSRVRPRSVELIASGVEPWDIWPGEFNKEPKPKQDKGPVFGDEDLEAVRKKLKPKGGVKAVGPTGLWDVEEEAGEASDGDHEDPMDAEIGISVANVKIKKPPTSSGSAAVEAEPKKVVSSSAPKQKSLKWPIVGGHELRYDAKQLVFGIHCGCADHNEGYKSACKMDRAAKKGPLGKLLTWVAQECLDRDMHARTRKRHFLQETRQEWRDWAAIHIPEAVEIEASCRDGDKSEPLVVD